MIASDIHGYYQPLLKLWDIFVKSEAEYLILLGDLIYHGPRNPLQAGYDPLAVGGFLKEHQNKIIIIKGNCESDADMMILGQPILEHNVALIKGHKVFLTHGHVYNENNVPSNLIKGDVLLRGHFHIPLIDELPNGIILASPGSIGVPKGGSQPSYILMDEQGIEGYTLTGEHLFKRAWDN